MVKKIHKILILLLSVLLCAAMTSCITFARAFMDALGTQSIDDREYVYGDENVIGITFEDGEMYAEWDYTDGVDYTLNVKTGDKTESYDKNDEGFTVGKTSLTDLGYTYWQDITLSLDATERSLMGKSTKTESYNYKALDAETYDKYTKTVKAGFKDVDYYIANRSEWFDFWSYLIIFRENCQYDDGCYELQSTVYMAYDYGSLYHTNDIEKAFACEVYSAIDAYEDSAAYNYSFDIDETGKIGTIYLKFLYDVNPRYTTASGSEYTNAIDASETVHYDISVPAEERTFAIDSVADTAQVSSSDQLYYTLKKGYRPVPVKGSNADYLYTEMRSILAEIISDSDGEATKAHYIYDYIVNTVVYDYDFTEEIYTDDEVAVSELFRYRCLYMEGVFGLGDNGEFDDGSRVAICDGLSKAYLSLARIEGMECIKISGTAGGEGHAWNKIKVNGVWYMVDTTWGNSLEKETGKEYLSHEYLLVPDDSAHVETSYITYPDARSRYYFGPYIDNGQSGGDKIIRPWFPGSYRDPHYSA